MSLDIQNSFADIFSSTYVAWRDVILNVDHCTDCRPSAYLLTLLLSRLSVIFSLLLSAPVKEFWNSVSIWCSYVVM